jgi:hypothetical protein
MKKAIVVLIPIFLVAVTLFASLELTTKAAPPLFLPAATNQARSFQAYDKIPPIELTNAYPLAEKVLGTNINQYHCVAAILTSGVVTNHPEGQWIFSFRDANQNYKCVCVFFDRTATNYIPSTVRN